MSPTETPLTYHRIISPTVCIPTDVSVPVQVGLLACQRDPLLNELETYVIICTVSLGIEATKDKKKTQLTIHQRGQPIYEVLLQDTVLFPEGGGQPSDIGYIKGQDGSSWEVLEVRRRGGHAIHYIQGDQATLQSLATGARVTVALGVEGLKRRNDHMSMHTSQHLISALLEIHLNLPTPSWYLTQSPNPAYIEVPRAPSPEELRVIENAANECCVQGTRVHIEVEQLDTAPRDQWDRNASKGLPADYTGGVSRTVVIENIDRNPCCGTHLPTLRGLSVFILPQTEPLSRGRARIFFCAGPRIRAYLAQTHNFLTAAATNYGCAPRQVPERLAFEAESRRKSHKRAEELENEVAMFIVQSLEIERQQLHDDSLLTTVHSAWRASPAASKPFLIVMVSSNIQHPHNNAIVLVFGSDEKEVKELGDKLKTKGIKGGGNAGKWSGKTDDWKATGGDKLIKGLLGI